MDARDDELDEIDQRLGDPWSMSDRERQGYFLFLFFVLAVAFCVLVICGVTKG